MAGAFESLREARIRLWLRYLKRDRDPDLLAEVGVARAYTQGDWEGVRVVGLHWRGVT